MKLRLASLLVLLVVLSLPAWSQGKDAPRPRPVIGPTTVTLGDGLATVAVPKGWAYLNKTDTQNLLKANGNEPDGSELGALMLADENSRFIILIEFEDIGYVKDDDADKLDADALLSQMKEATEEANAARKEQGFSPIHVTGWDEKPHYDKSKHFIIWGIEGEGSHGKFVNYNTRILGRHGVLSLNLLTSKADLEKDKPYVAQAITATKYSSGKSYADYQPSDKVSEGGLTGLILGSAGIAAAAKLGFFAKIGKLLFGFLLIFKKGAFLIVVALVALAGKLFGKKNHNEEPPAA